MSWRAIPMKFPGTCTVCKGKIAVGEVALWAKGLGVKHQSCAEEDVELDCAVCGGKAGCSQCEFMEDCDRKRVSQLCICKKCYEAKDSFALYQRAISRNYKFVSP